MLTQLVIWCLVAVSLSAQPQVATSLVSDQLLNEAITAGQAGEGGAYLIDGLAEPDNLTVVKFGIVYTPYARVATASREAKKMYRPFSLDDAKKQTFSAIGTGGAMATVFEALKDRPLAEPLTYIVALPFSRVLNATTMGDAASMISVKHVVILSGGQAIQPVWIKPYQVVFQNAMGAKIEKEGLVAAFNPGDIVPGNQFVFIYVGSTAPGLDLTEQRRRILKKDGESWK